MLHQYNIFLHFCLKHVCDGSGPYKIISIIDSFLALQLFFSDNDSLLHFIGGPIVSIVDTAAELHVTTFSSSCTCHDVMLLHMRSCKGILFILKSVIADMLICCMIVILL